MAVLDGTCIDANSCQGKLQSVYHMKKEINSEEQFVTVYNACLPESDDEYLKNCDVRS